GLNFGRNRWSVKQTDPTFDKSYNVSYNLRSGVVNVLMTTPLWVINMRIKMQGTRVNDADRQLRKYPHYEGGIDAILKISRTEGLLTLWSSTLPSLVLVSNPALQFMIYELLKREAQQLL